jgi:predicted aspartyl protease
MTNPSILRKALLVPTLLLNTTAAFADQNNWEIPFKLKGHSIVVEASAGKKSGLKFTIDTGATCSVLDKSVVKALGLQQEPGEFLIMAFGQVTKAKRFYLPDLRIGPVFVTLHCLESDLSHLGVDGIIGLDLLLRKVDLASCATQEIIKCKNFTIDFESRKLRFGIQQQLKHTVPLEVEYSQIVVSAKIQGRIYRLSVDTGASMMILFKGSQLGAPESTLAFQRVNSSSLGGNSQSREVLLPVFELGTSRWHSLGGVVLNATDQPLDGVMAVVPLNIKILHFDFMHNLLSWNK